MTKITHARFMHKTCLLSTGVVAIAVLLLLEHTTFAPTQNTINPQPKITLSVPSLGIVLPAGGQRTIPISVTSNNTLLNAVIEPVPELAPFIKITPATLDKLEAGHVQQILLTFSIPAGTTPATHDGTIHLRLGKQTIPQTLKLTLVVNAGQVSVVIPPLFDLNQQVLGLGGPIALNNFGSSYSQGAIIPLGGAEIDITWIRRMWEIQKWLLTR